MISSVRRKLSQVLNKELYQRIDHLEETIKVGEELHRRVDRLDGQIKSHEGLSKRIDRLEEAIFGDSNPLQHHSREVIRLLTLGVAAVYGVDVEGEVAEFGTMTGVSAVGLAKAIASCDNHLGYAVSAAGLRKKELHLFDSFQGLPQVSEGVDIDAPHVKSGVWAAGTCVGLTKEELASHVAQFLDPARVRIFEGWFRDTLHNIPDGTKYALVHVDSDLYSSAIEVLDYLFSKKIIAEGALIFFDDWNCNKGAPELGERRAWRECMEKYHVVCSDEGSYGLFSHKFLVHSYK